MLLLHRALLSVGGAASSSWTPADLGSDLIGWYKADTGVTESGGSVSQWDDQSGLGEHLDVVSGTKPTYSATGFNSSYHGITFNSTNVTYLACESFACTSSANLSVFVVARMDSGTPSYGRLISYASSGQANDFDNNTSSVLIARNGTSNNVVSYRAGSNRANSNITMGTNYRMGTISDGTNNTFYLDNSASTPVAFSPSFGTNGRLIVGNRWQSSSYAWSGLSGTIAEIVIAKKALTSDERNDLDAYFTTKWGL